MRRILPAILLVLPLAAPPAAAGGGDPASELAVLINTERSARRLPLLAADTSILPVASRHSQDMASAGRIFHNEDLAKEVSGWQLLGENVGRGIEAKAIHRAFMESSAHRSLILDPHFRGLAIGLATAAGTLWVTELFILRQAPAVAKASQRVPAEPVLPSERETAVGVVRRVAPVPEPLPPIRLTAFEALLFIKQPGSRVLQLTASGLIFAYCGALLLITAGFGRTHRKDFKLSLADRAPLPRVTGDRS